MIKYFVLFEYQLSNGERHKSSNVFESHKVVNRYSFKWLEDEVRLKSESAIKNIDNLTILDFKEL